MSDSTIENGRPVVFRGGTVLTMNDAHDVLHDADVLVVGDKIAGVGPEPRGARGRVRDRRLARHRHARHGRHPPAHVADGAARLRRRLDAEPVLRLLLPRVGEDLPPAGHRRREPAVGDRVARRGRDDDRRLVARAADRRPRRRGGRRAGVGARPLRAGLREHPAGPVGVVGVGGLQELRRAPLRFEERHARVPDGVRRHRRSGVPRAGGVQGRARARRSGHHARGRVGRDQRRRHPAHARARLHDAGEHLRARVHADRGLLPPDRRHRRLGVGVDRERAERRPGLPADVGAAQARHPGLALDGHQRVVERRPVLRHAHHARRRPLARAPGGARQAETVTNHHLRAEQVVDWATRGGSRALGHGLADRQPRGGQEGRRRARQERCVAGHVPGAAPVRARRLPGAARRRPHRARGRPRRQAGRQARRHRPRAGASGRRRDRRVRDEYPRRRGVDGRDAPGDPGDRDPREPVPVHRMGEGGERPFERGRAGHAGGDPRGAGAPPGH